MRYATTGNMTSRGNSQDGDQNPFFFEQTSFRRAPKRYKKTPDELPDELKYAHLGPRVAAFLATKDKDKLEESQEFKDGLGNKSLLPEINKKVSLLRTSLDSLLSSKDDQIRVIFHESKTNAPALLVQLAKVLYLWEGLHPSLPRSLSFYLGCKFKEFVGEIEVHPREWQLLSSKEEYLAKLLAIEAAQKEEGRNSVLSNTRSSEDFEMEKTGRDNLIGKDSEGRLSRSKSKVMSRASTLADITESEESKRKDLSRPVSRQDTLQRTGSKKDILKGETPKIKTRLEKYRSGMNLDSKAGPDSRRGRPTDSALGESFGDNSRMLGGGAKDAGYWAIINFQLSSKLCEDMGWIIHPDSKDDPERETLLEWATQRLQVAIKQKKEQAEEAVCNGLDRPVVFRYYGDSRKEMVDRYKTTRVSSAYSSRNKPVFKGEKPSIPLVDTAKSKDKLIFITTTSDGSTTIFYPSGKPAIVTCRSVGGNAKLPASYYYMVYSNTTPQRMLAVFTPWGHCCAYHDNDKIKFLADKGGGTLADTDGNIQRRWTWPNWTQKLPVTIVFQLNNSITLRCMNLNQMQLYFNHNKESYKLNIGVTNLTEEPPVREEIGHLITGINFQSKTAKEFAKPYRAKSNIKSKAKGPRSKFLRVSRSPSPAVDRIEMEEKAAAKAELEKLLEFTEPTKNDPEADKELSRIQHKVQNIVEDWLDHYRMAMGIKSPYLQGLQDKPSVKKTRNVHSAKPGGGVVVIEREATTIPRPSLSYRVPSAPLSHTVLRPVTGGSVRSDRATELKESVVKFDDNPQEIEPDAYSLGRSMTIGRDSSLGSASSSHSSRVHSAPQSSLVDLSPSIGICPVAVRLILLGHSHVICRCSRHKIPFITDVEFDTFIKRQAPEKQLIVIAVTSTTSGWVNPVETMLEQLHDEKNRNRTRPCMQSRNDPFRVFWYDVATAAEFSDHGQPLLLRRHNVVPGMFLIYETGKLLFCDQIFNGYGSARKDFHKQLIGSRQAAVLGKVLPPDFKFSPQKGRPGQRAAWGGDMGILVKPQSSDPARRGSNSSFSSGDSKDLPIDNQISGAGYSMNRVINRSLTEAAIWERHSPRPSAAYNVMSQSQGEGAECGGQEENEGLGMSSFTHLPEIKSSA